MYVLKLSDVHWYTIATSYYFHFLLFILHLTTTIFQWVLSNFRVDGDMYLYQIESDPVELSHVVTINVYTIDISFELFTALSHLTYGLIILCLDNDISFDCRMYEYAVTASLMVFIVALISGIRDLNSLIFIIGLIITTMLLGRNHEVNWTQGAYSNKPVYKTPTVLGWFPYMWAWLFIFVQFYRSDSKTEVHAIIWFMFIAYSAFGINQIVYLRGDFNEISQVKYNAVSNILSVSSKLILSWVLFSDILI